MRTAVVVGRFQIDWPHEGHLYLIKEAKERSRGKVVVVIGESKVHFTDKNPLTFAIRRDMIRKIYPDVDILYLQDRPSDEEWSRDLDDLLEGYSNVTLYGARDSFIPRYTGRHHTMLIDSPISISSSERRKKIATNPVNSPEFRQGVIYAVENKYPTAYPTVDIALIKYKAGGNEGHNIFLGRKPGETLYRFPGGFVDPSDLSLEQAANRELKEEVTGIATHGYPTYICSHKIKDSRYGGTKDGIITSLFLSYFMSGNPQAGDDLEEVKEFVMDDFNPDLLVPHHHILLGSLKYYLNNLK